MPTALTDCKHRKLNYMGRKLLVHFSLFISVALMFVGCGNRRLSDEVLQHKLDSVYALEAKRQLKLRGIELEESSPFQMFYDSLDIQTLPIRYSDDYVRYLPGFRVVPLSIMTYLELEGREAPKAMSLPETIGTRLVLLAADINEEEYELWLYSLDNEYVPVDKLLLYEPQYPSKTNLLKKTQEPYFSITSDYKIRVIEYRSGHDRYGQLSTFYIDEARMFVEEPPY